MEGHTGGAAGARESGLAALALRANPKTRVSSRQHRAGDIQLTSVRSVDLVLRSNFEATIRLRAV